MGLPVNEICRVYRAAKNKSEQIRILSELYDVTIDKIKQILSDNGEVIAEPPKTNRGRKKKAEIEKSDAMPETVLKVLSAELDEIDRQIKPLTDELNLLTSRYNEISTFIKTYGNVVNCIEGK